MNPLKFKQKNASAYKPLHLATLLPALTSQGLEEADISHKTEHPRYFDPVLVLISYEKPTEYIQPFVTIGRHKGL